MKRNKKLAIIGAGSLGVMTLDAAISQGNYTEDQIVFIDDGKKKGERLYNIPIIGGLRKILTLDINEYDFIVAIANNKTRKKIVESSDIPFVNIIHPDSCVSKLATIGEGNIILPNVTIDPEAVIHNHVVINKNTSIGHNVEMENYSQASPGCLLGGSVKECTFLGMGTMLLPNITVGKDSIVGAGSVVTKEIPASCTAVGAPAKPIKFHKEN